MHRESSQPEEFKPVEKEAHGVQKFGDLFNDLVDVMDIAMWELDMNYRVIASNRKAREIYGENAIGHFCYYVAAQRDSACPGCPAKKVYEGCASGRSEHKRTDFHGNTIYIDHIATPIRDGNDRLMGALVLIIDITERKLAEEALRESREKLEGIISSAIDHMIMVDEGHSIVWANDVAKRLFGPDLEGEKCYRAFHGYDKICQPCLVKRCFENGDVQEQETEVIAGDGTRMVFWCTASVAFRYEDGRPKTVVEVSRDMTDRKLAEKKLLAYHKRLRELAAQLSLAEEKERRRIAVEVHDHIGQNLAFAKMKLGGLKESVSSPDCLSAVEEIIKLVDSTIQDTRSLVSEIGSPVLYELGLIPAIHGLTQKFQRQHGFNVQLENDRDPKSVSDDVQILLFQAVKELLANVAKHAKATTCTVSLKVQDEDVRVDVIDDGIGFDPEDIETSGEKGPFFGLFSIRERLEPLGGSLSIHSRSNKGTRVTLLAPLKT